MTELHIEIDKFPLEKALFCASLAHVKHAGFLSSDLSLTAQKIKEKKKLLHELALMYDIEVLLGFKIMYVPPQLIPDYTERLKEKGFDYICVHGENINDLVAEGTNFAALSANVDILCNAGLIDKNLLEYAQEKKTYFEFNVNPLYSSGNALLADAVKNHNIRACWGNTIQSETDFVHSLKRKQYAYACPSAQESDLIKKLNQDTAMFVQETIKQTRVYS